MEKNLKSVLNRHGFSFKKAFGQNFLTDTSLLQDIVEKAGVSENDIVLEIGPGAGALTSELCKRAKKVVCYEIDTKLKPVLDEMLEDYSNYEIVFKDIMKENLTDLEKKLGGEYILVANLPYYITTPIVMRFIEDAKNVKAMVIMVQEEVAYRFSAKNSSSDYGAITVGINLRGNAEILIKVPREKFTPAPNVDSAVVKISIDRDKFKDVDKNAVRNLVRCAFSSRRKMLANNLINTLKISRQQAETALNTASINLTSRGENLSVEDFINLTNALIQMGIKL